MPEAEEQIPVYDPQEDRTFYGLASSAKTYEEAGYSVGPMAELAAREHGWEGKLATGMLGVSRGASLGLSDLFIPRNLARVQERVAKLHPVTELVGEVAGSVGPFALAGGAAAAGAARLGAPKLANLAATSARVAAAATQGGIAATAAARRTDDPLTAEHFAQGVGYGAMYGALGEAVGSALQRLGPAIHRRMGKFLARAKESPSFKRIVAGKLTPDEVFAARADGAIEELNKVAANMGDVLGPSPGPGQGPASLSFLDELRARHAGSEIGPIKEGSGALKRSSGPPPLPIPWAQARLAESIPEIEAAQKPLADWAAERRGLRASDNAREGVKAGDAARLLDEPMTQGEATDSWQMLDREAAEAARMGDRSLAGDLRTDRDYFSANRGMGEEELSAWRAGREKFATPDPELDAAFEGAGMVDRPSKLPPMPELPRGGPVYTDVPPEPRRLPSVDLSPEPLPAPVEMPRRPLPPPDRARPPPRPMEIPGLDKSRAEFNRIERNAAIPSPYGAPQSRYAVRSGFTRPAVATAALSFIPVVGQHLATAYGAASAAVKATQYATAYALNHEAAVNRVVQRVVGPALERSGQAIRMLLEGQSGRLSEASVDVDEAYKAISAGVSKAATRPESIETYFERQYGPLLQEHPELYGKLVQNATVATQYLNEHLPRQTYEGGVSDEPYDPPRSVKIRYMEQFKGVNDPYAVIAEPTKAGIDAVEATHPETLRVVRRQLLMKLSDPARVRKLSGEHKRRLSLVLGAPLTRTDTSTYVSGLQAAVANAGKPPQEQQPKTNVNLTNGFASSVAPPSLQRSLGDVQR